MEGLSVAIQQRRVHFPEGPLLSELETFEYEYTRTGVRYRAPDGLHDDCVCALALAVQLYTTDYDQEPLRLLTGALPPRPSLAWAKLWNFLNPPKPPKPWALPIDQPDPSVGWGNKDEPGANG
jgi:hypothetical protein